jgi:hypothetical protein
VGRQGRASKARAPTPVRMKVRRVQAWLHKPGKGILMRRRL